MIEVNLYSVSAPDARTGRCISRSRFDKETMGVGVMEFVKGFLKDSLEKFERGLGSNTGIEDVINSSDTLTTKDFASIKYYLNEAGYTVQIQNVTDDEENAVGIPSGEVIEWNVIDHNFYQHGYPTAIKIIPGDGMDIAAVLRRVVETSGLFNKTKFGGIKNPLTELLNNMDNIKKVTNEISPSITTRIYALLDQMGIEIFCAQSED